MRHYRVTFHKAGRAGTFIVSGLANACAPARAFLVATQDLEESRAAVEALTPAGVVTFGTVPHGVVTIQRID